MKEFFERCDWKDFEPHILDRESRDLSQSMENVQARLFRTPE